MYLINGGKIEAIKRCSTITERKCLPEGPSRYGLLVIWITSVWICGVLLYLVN